MLWEIYQIDRKRKLTILGRVRARNSGAAMLRALKKYRITDPYVQRRIGARPVKQASRQRLDITKGDRAALREMSGLIRRVLSVSQCG